MPGRLIASCLAVVLAGCDVEVSLGRIDAGDSIDGAALDTSAADAPTDVLFDAACTATADASACDLCLAGACCSALSACEAAGTCSCIVGCVIAGDGDAAACSTHCGADGGEHTAVLTCAHDHCTPTCP